MVEGVLNQPKDMSSSQAYTRYIYRMASQSHYAEMSNPAKPSTTTSYGTREVRNEPKADKPRPTIHMHNNPCRTASIRSKTWGKELPTAGSHSPTQNPINAYSVHEIKLWGYRCLHPCNATEPTKRRCISYHPQEPQVLHKCGGSCVATQHTVNKLNNRMRREATKYLPRTSQPCRSDRQNSCAQARLLITPLPAKQTLWLAVLLDPDVASTHADLEFQEIELQMYIVSVVYRCGDARLLASVPTETVGGRTARDRICSSIQPPLSSSLSTLATVVSYAHDRPCSVWCWSLLFPSTELFHDYSGDTEYLLTSVEVETPPVQPALLTDWYR